MRKGTQSAEEETEGGSSVSCICRSDPVGQSLPWLTDLFRLDLETQEAGKASGQWNDNRSVACRSSRAADQRVAREEMTRRAEGSPGPCGGGSSLS